MRQSSFAPVFVDTMPEVLEEGVLYISVRYRTASHLCACGCGERVVTPIKPARWCFTYDGETVSLFPSIGRWQSPCSSHYYIAKNTVVWARNFSVAEREAVLRRDAQDLHEYHNPGVARGGQASPVEKNSARRDWRPWRRGRR